MMTAASGARVGGLARALDDTSYAYVLKVGDTEVVHIYSEPQTESVVEEVPTIEQLNFLSGITGPSTLVTKQIGTRTIKQLHQFKPTAACAKAFKLPGGWADSPRLGVKPWAGFDEYDDPYGRLSQYGVIHPSMYSGLMRKCVQVVLGYGHLPPQQIPVSGQDKKLYQQYGAQVRYDYRWARTHGLVKAEDGKLWLVEIGITHGVIATPLPLAPDTARYADPAGDARGQAAAVFKGLPSGLAFPIGPALQKAIQAGTVVQLATPTQLAPFYKMTAYSTAMGWSFNDDGTEAHNTGWYWGDDQIRRAAHYSLQIHIGPTKAKREPNEPLATGSAVLRLVSEGMLYHPSPNTPPPIKFYEPLLPGLLSVDMRASRDETGVADTSVAHIPVCDCTMHVCHVDNQLKLVRYFWDRTLTNPAPIVTDNFEQCMYIGSWFQESDQTFVTIPPTFYTTDFDDRKAPDPTITRTDIVGSDVGRWFYSVGDELDMSPIPCWGFAQRNRMYRMVTTTVRPQSKYNVAAIVVPGGLRDGYVYANLQFDDGKSTLTQISYKSLPDPYGHLTFRTYFHPPRAGDGCYTQFDRKVYSFYTVTTDQCALDLCDQGEWMELCQNADLLPKSTPVPPPTSTSVTVPPTTAVDAYLVCSTYGSVKLKARSEPTHWQSKSPNEFGMIQNMYAFQNCFGIDHLVYNEDIDGPLTLSGPMLTGEPDQYYNFIGVI